MRRKLKIIILSGLALTSFVVCLILRFDDSIEPAEDELEFLSSDIEPAVPEKAPSDAHVASVKGERFYGTVDTTFWNSAESSGVPSKLLAKVADALACSIDVNRQARRGDSWSALMRGSELVAVEYRTSKRIWRGVRGVTPETSSSFFDPSGENLCDLFRKSPVRYERITSGFSSGRFHPIFQFMRPHLGVDYAAPAGTPVVALGDGIITDRSFNGEAGNVVEITHQQGFVSKYKHLSRFELRIPKGAEVKRGQVIGYVGATGAATGPHLHFELIRNGVQINPESFRLERPQVLAEDDLAQFKLVSKEILAELSSNS